MTYQQYITAQLSRFNVSAEEIALIFIEQGLSPDTEVTDAASLIPVKTAIYNWAPFAIAGLQNVSEGGYSITWNVDGFKLWYAWLADGLGLPDQLNEKPTVRGVSVW